MLCRAIDCGCEATNGKYCDMCEGYRPICPQCGAAYGEHSRDCTVADGYLDCQEGPWESKELATEFAQAEVGAPWQVICGAPGQWFVMAKEIDD